MTKKWTAEKEAELVGAEAALVKAIDDRREKMHTLLNQDGEFAEAVHEGQYNALATQDASDQMQLSRVRGELGDIRAVKPRERGTYDVDADAPARFLRGGSKNLAADELEAVNKAMEEAGEYAGIPAGGTGMLILPRSHQAAGELVSGDGVAGTVSGGALVDTETQPRLVESLANFGGVKKMCQRYVSMRGNPVEVPNIDAKSQKGRRLSGQGADVQRQNAAQPGTTTINAYTYSSDSIRVGMEMIQDTAYDIVGYVYRQARRRLGVITNEEFTTADGVDKPRGVVTAAGAGIVLAARNAVTWQELLNAQYKIDDAYLEDGEEPPAGNNVESGGRTGYMISRGFEYLIRTLADADRRPLWIPGITADAPNMIHGFPYELNYAMAAPDANEASQVVGLFGNFAYQMIRTSMAVMVYGFWDSRTAQNNAQEVLAFCREDSEHIGPGNTAEAFKRITTAA